MATTTPRCARVFVRLDIFRASVTVVVRAHLLNLRRASSEIVQYLIVGGANGKTYVYYSHGLNFSINYALVFFVCPFFIDVQCGGAYSLVGYTFSRMCATPMLLTCFSQLITIAHIVRAVCVMWLSRVCRQFPYISTCGQRTCAFRIVLALLLIAGLPHNNTLSYQLFLTSSGRDEYCRVWWSTSLHSLSL